MKMTETLANGYSSESAQRELSNEYQLDCLDGFQHFLQFSLMDESSLSIGRVNVGLEDAAGVLLWTSVCTHFNGLTHLHSERPKRGLTILEILYLQSHFLENIWRRIVYQKSNNNSPSNILWTFS